MVAAHLHWIETYGYFGIFFSLMLGIFGLPVPDETLLTFIGYLIFKKYFHAVPAFLTAFFGSICGITLSYTMGRILGLPLLTRYGKILHGTPERLAQAHQWFEKYGKWTLFGGYFIPGVRHLTALSAGISALEYRRFAPFAYSGGLLWVGTFMTIGYVIGEEWRKVLATIMSYLWVFVAGFGCLGLASYLAFRFLRSRPRNQTGSQN